MLTLLNMCLLIPDIVKYVHFCHIKTIEALNKGRLVNFLFTDQFLDGKVVDFWSCPEDWDCLIGFSNKRPPWNVTESIKMLHYNVAVSLASIWTGDSFGIPRHQVKCLWQFSTCTEIVFSECQSAAIWIWVAEVPVFFWPLLRSERAITLLQKMMSFLCFGMLICCLFHLIYYLALY